jgi:hypothetical protein
MFHFILLHLLKTYTRTAWQYVPFITCDLPKKQIVNKNSINTVMISIRSNESTSQEALACQTYVFGKHEELVELRM